MTDNWNATCSPGCEMMEPAYILRSLLAVQGAGDSLARSACWAFRAAAKLSWDASSLKQIGREISVNKLMKLSQQHLERCPAAMQPECAISTLTFMATLTESGVAADDRLWDTLNCCLEGLPEDKTDQLSVMINAVINKQGSSHLWDRILQTMQSRLETNLGAAFGSESPKSFGSCCSDEGFTNEARGMWFAGRRWVRARACICPFCLGSGGPSSQLVLSS